MRAIHLIDEFIPVVSIRMRRDVSRIILLKAGGSEYWPFSRAIVLKKATVESAEPELLAMTLIHEGTHARLWSMGIGYPARARARIERLCVRTELRLARQLPDAAALEAFALAKLDREWWSEAAVAERRRRARNDLTEQS